MADLDSLTDAEIRKKLTEFNYPVVAVTGTTRKLYIKKLKQLIEQSDSNERVPSRSSAKFSSGESSDDELKKPATRSKKNTPTKVITPVKTTRRRSTGRVAGNYNGESHTLSTSFSDEQISNAHVNDSPSPNVLSENRSSIFNKVSSRRSLHPDLDLSIGRSSGIFSAFENDLHSTDLEGINRSALGSSSSKFSSRGLDNSTQSPSTFSTGGFKSRFMNSLHSENGTSKSMGDYDNNFISELRNRTGGSKPNNMSTSYSNKFGNVELSNVKESDDEDQLPNTLSQSTFNSRPRYNKWTAVDNPWWKNSSLVSKGLVAVLGVFFLIIFLFYLGVTSKDASISTPDTNFPICRGDSGAEVECIRHEDIRPLMEIFQQIYQELNHHVTNHKCENPDRRTAISLRQLGQHLIKNGKLNNVWDFEKQSANNLQILILANPQWGIKIENDMLDIPEPHLPMSCAIRNNLVFLVWMSAKVFFLCGLLGCAYKAFEWWVSRRNEHDRQVFRLVEQIINMVSSHCSENRDRFLAINHVRDQLIPPQQRSSMQKIWDEAVLYLESKESRIRTEVQLVSGEEFRVWRWLSGASGGSKRKVWQGQAFETMEGSPNSLPISPTPCLKIRHMFDPDVEVGEGWMTQVKNAILEKCENAKVVHVAVDRGSSEGCVYLKCSSQEEAGKAYRSLHGSWFDSKLVTVKYLRLERYHERFPEAERCSTPLRPSNNQRLSLQ